jgi:hypothetical protein
MKTTLDLPDALMRRIKLRAVHRNQRLKDAIAQLLEAGISATARAEREGLPELPRPLRLKGRVPLRAEDVEAAIVAGRD